MADQGTSKIIKNAVDRRFRPPNAGIAARNQAFVLGGTALIVWAALNLSGWPSWLLWAWVAYRAFVFAMVLVIGGDLSDELNRRLELIPPALRRVLDGTA